MVGRIPGPIGINEDEDFGLSVLDIGAARSAMPGPLLDVPCAAEFHRNGNHRAALSEFERFKQEVLDQQIANNVANHRKYYEAVPAGELKKVEGDIQLRTAAADQCVAMVAAIRKAKPANVSFVVASGYRDYEYDKGVWMRNFRRLYYPNTEKERAKLKGGKHGKAAVRLLARYISPRKAAPGFSNHSDGIAVDFETTDSGVPHKIDTSPASRAGWHKAWLHGWLVENAAGFHFYELQSEEWHWEYHVGKIPPNLFAR
jgi:LAS superfamily LD-carboxypeptidase LdcB